jgi:hypothetical protein
MIASILIPCRNYARYVGAAIDSALGQTHPDVEVIVVDDGSTDESRAVIASYGDRITPVFKENAGPVSALNAAFELSHGELICLLDADDVFERDKVERVMAAAREMPNAYLIHHQLQPIDGDGRTTTAPFPRHIPTGDLRARTLRSSGWFPHPVSSGLSFRRSYAERVFPLPGECVVAGSADQSFSVIADTYLAGPAALLRPVAGIQAPLARYRMHGANRNSNVTRASRADQLRRYEAEVATVMAVMQQIFGMPVELGMEQHLDYQLLGCAVGEISRSRVVARVMRSDSLPFRIRLRETLRLLANRHGAPRA